MKKIFLILAVIGGLLTSCDMDKSAFGALDDETAIRNLSDVESYTNVLYSALRGKTAGAWINYPEIQMDLYHGLISNGNNAGTFANGIILSSDQDIESFWASCYGTIGSANYIIDKILVMQEAEKDEASKIQYGKYLGVALFTRAFCYTWLVDHFCVNYGNGNADTPALGLPLVTKYHPSSDRSSYPGRSTLGETFKLINDDLATAHELFATFAQSGLKDCEPITNDPYLNVYAVASLQARVALLMGDNETALAKAEEVINSKVYSLTTLKDYNKLWTEDKGTEVIFRPFQSNIEGLASTGGTYFLSDNEESAYYIPTITILDLYGENDIRFDAFFTIYDNLKVNGKSYACYVFNKYPGNDALKTASQRNFCNMMKPFRLSEQYLIAAESAALMGKADVACKYLNGLRAQRLRGYKDVSLKGDELLDAVKEERFKELLGEGFRMSDLRRWHIGFQRNPEHPENPTLSEIITSQGAALSYAADDHRFVWPIPATEIQTNPQLDGQQNPGY
ncbi:MAG: RagB/SusD family nutrient uptake outer membrane protein [Bacteroidaceae bacterium]|nr:RagB/SusD family nutrient uptake outer membrane protein [Bacteroidaceae bacterium]